MGSEILTSQGEDPVIGGSKDHTAGHTDMSLGQITTSLIGSGRKPTTRLVPPGRTRCRVVRTKKFGTLDGVVLQNMIVVAIIK